MRPMPGPLDRSVCSDSTLCPCEPAPPGEDRRAWSGDRSPGLTVALSGFSALRTPITQRSGGCGLVLAAEMTAAADGISPDRKSTRLNSSHVAISYAVFYLKKKNIINI